MGNLFASNTIGVEKEDKTVETFVIRPASEKTNAFAHGNQATVTVVTIKGSSEEFIAREFMDVIGTDAKREFQIERELMLNPHENIIDFKCLGRIKRNSGMNVQIYVATQGSLDVFMQEKERKYKFMMKNEDKITPKNDLYLLSEVTTISLVKQLCLGIQHIHSGFSSEDPAHPGFVHRDLKPENIYIDVRDRTILKIGDLGKIRSNIITPDTPQTNSVGTQGWWAPEAKVTHNPKVKYSDMKKTDIWSAGLIILYLIVGPTVMKNLELKVDDKTYTISLLADATFIRVEHNDMEPPEWGSSKNGLELKRQCIHAALYSLISKYCIIGKKGDVYRGLVDLAFSMLMQEPHDAQKLVPSRPDISQILGEIKNIESKLK
jgi:serine/threonine protein kinase